MPSNALVTRLPLHVPLGLNSAVMLQRHGIVIETCMVGNQDSAFLQQAAHITEGLYLRPRRPAALLQYLLVSIVLSLRSKLCNSQHVWHASALHATGCPCDFHDLFIQMHENQHVILTCLQRHVCSSMCLMLIF